jgi:nicotinamide-nucleotide amidase
MQADIIAIGDELLIGQTINSNAAWLGQELGKIGVRVYRATAIGDDRAEILRMLDEAASRSKVVIITGGLGPTKDDITKHTLCEYFESGLVTNEEALERITEYFTSRGLPMLDINRQQADLPEKCKVIQNHRGTACGMWFEKNGTIFVSMPGVPYEMQGMMEEVVLPEIAAYFERPRIIHRTVLTIGVGESFLAKKIEKWENSLSEKDVKLAYLPSPGMVKLRMSSYSGDEQVQTDFIAQKEKELMQLIGEHVYGYDQDTLQSVIGQLLRKRQAQLSVAESCTGGFLSHLLTSEAGSSDFFAGGVVSYSVDVKMRLLGVNPEMIEQFGVVSEEVAAAMATGVREKLKTTYGLATTGIAGPAGGTDRLPVGTICLAVAGPRGVKTLKKVFTKRRQMNIELASNAALDMLRKEILKENDG